MSDDDPAAHAVRIAEYPRRGVRLRLGRNWVPVEPARRRGGHVIGDFVASPVIPGDRLSHGALGRLDLTDENAAYSQ